jgi:F-box-like
MHNHDFLLPELIDDVFQYLQKGDLYRCSQVNRQFNARAIPLLYRTVELFFHAPVWYPKAKGQENGVWSQLCTLRFFCIYMNSKSVSSIIRVGNKGAEKRILPSKNE